MQNVLFLVGPMGDCDLLAVLRSVILTIRAVPAAGGTSMT